MNPGMVLHWKDFQFEDGGKATKLIIVLSHPRDGACLAVKTTSQSKPYRTSVEGCHSDDGYYFVKGPSKVNWFNLDTWILIGQPLELDCTKVKAAIEAGVAQVKTNLAIPFVGAIRNCLGKSPDVSELHLSYLK